MAQTGIGISHVDLIFGLAISVLLGLGIIRFRTVIKDSRDMVFLFFAIAIGLGCGTYNFIVTAVATLFLLVVLVVVHLCRFGAEVHAD